MYGSVENKISASRSSSGGSTSSTSNGSKGERARAAYRERDAETSRLLHGENNRGHDSQIEGHKASGNESSLKSIVYGGLDGILTAFAVVVAAAGGNLRPEIVLILGISTLFAEAFSMGVCDTISSLSYIDHVRHEARREEWEYDNFAEGEISEMVDLYVSRGLPRDKAERVVTTMAKYRDFFISIMVLEELQLKIPDPNDSPLKDGFVTFASFLLFGSSPIIGYVVFPVIMPGVDSNFLFWVALFTTSIALFGLGVFKSGFSAMSWWKSGLEFLFLGLVVALSSYLISISVSHILLMKSETNDNSMISSGNGTLLNRDHITLRHL